MPKESPGEIIVWHYYRLPRDQKYLDLAVLYPGASLLRTQCPGWVRRTDGL